MGTYKCVFSFYGGKSKLSHLYPPPEHAQIIEPFAGGAGYALRHYDCAVHLTELDDRVVSIWQWLLSPEIQSWVTQIPATMPVGAKISESFPNGSVPPGMIEYLRSECNHGTQGARGVHDQVTTLGSNGWPRIRPRLEYWLPRIRHWTIRHGSYETVGNRRATWFLDPPYQNPAGARYRQAQINYPALARWARSRMGQVIVCENQGATWLPFEPLVTRRGIQSRYQVSQAVEVMWTRGDE